MTITRLRINTAITGASFDTLQSHSVSIVASIVVLVPRWRPVSHSGPAVERDSTV
jgi:hypothetical protein